jgi:hypothetical protein
MKRMFDPSLSKKEKFDTTTYGAGTTDLFVPL